MKKYLTDIGILILIFPILVIFGGTESQKELSPAGTKRWAYTYMARIEEPAQISSLKKGGYILSASLSKSPFGTKVFVMQTKATGRSAWQKTFDTPLSSQAQGSRELKKGNILIWGEQIPSFDDDRKANSSNGFLLELSKKGNILSQKKYGVTDWDYEYSFQAVEELKGGGFIACGSIDHLNKSTTWYNDESQGWIVKLTSSGKIEFQKAIALKTTDYYKYIRMTDIHETSDGGFIGIGWYYSSPEWSATNVGILVVKLSSSGDIIWEKAFDAGDYRDAGKFLIEARKVFPAKDGGYLLIGCDWVDDYPWCVRLDSKGEVKWGKAFIRSSNDDDVEYNDASPTKDGGCLFGGAIYPLRGDRLAWLAKLNKKGVVKANRSYSLGSNYYNHFMGITENQTRGYAVIGRSYNEYANRELWAMTTVANGKTCSPLKPNKYKPETESFMLFEKEPTFTFSQSNAAESDGGFVPATMSANGKSWCGKSTQTWEDTLDLTILNEQESWFAPPRWLKIGHMAGNDTSESLMSLRTLMRSRALKE